MNETRKIAISMPADLFRRVESHREETGETRSAFYRRAVEEYFRQREREGRVAEYIEGYRTHPESPDEQRATEAAAMDVFSEEPWE